MAIFESTAFDRLRKSFGNLTVYHSRGQNILKGKVSEINDANTLEQQKNRRKMKTLVGLCSLYEQALSIGFPQRPQNYTPDNMFFQENKAVVTVDEQLNVTIDYEKIIVAKGNRMLPEVSVARDFENNRLTFTHQAEEFVRHGAGDDQLYTVLLERELQRVKVLRLNVRMDVDPVVVSLPEKWEMENLMVYVLILSKDMKNASTSRFVEPS